MIKKRFVAVFDLRYIWLFIIISFILWTTALKAWEGWGDSFFFTKPRSEPIITYTNVLEGVYLIANKGFDPKGEKERIKAIIISKASEMGVNYKLALEIARKESGFVSDVCNFKYNCKSGQGIYQLIPSTHKYCEEKLGRKLDVFKAEDNIDCGLYLLKTDGVVHWEKWSGPYLDYD